MKAINLFEEWCNIKQITNNTSKIVGIKERNIAFIKIGKNIGYEQNGKGDLFLRPVIVIKVFNRSLFFAIPLTSKEKKGSFFHKIKFFHKENLYESTAILAQARTFDTKRVLYTKGMIEKNDFLNLKEEFYNLTLKEGAPKGIDR